jgi:hypothetical protein
MMSVDQILIEINTQCVELCFISDQMKNYINSKAEELNREKPSQVLIQSIFGSIKFTNSTHVHNQDAIINAFVSNVVFENSLISSLTVKEKSIVIISSNFEFSGMNVTSISNTGSYELIDVSSDSYMKMTNVSYNHSDSLLFTLKSSGAFVSDVFMNSIKNANNLFEVIGASWVELHNFKIDN